MARKEVGFVVTDDYKTWIEEVKNKIRNSQIKASVRINYEMLDLYWNLGVAICEKQNQAKWGDAFLKVMSNDLQKAFPGVSGFSVENLKHIRYWYNFYTNNEKWLQGVTQIESMVKSIPWGHNQRIMYKCKDIDEALFYIQKNIKTENNVFENILQYIQEKYSDSNLKFISIGGINTEINHKVLDDLKTKLKIEQIILEVGRYLVEDTIELETRIIRDKMIRNTKTIVIKNGIYSGFFDILLYNKRFQLYLKTENNEEIKFEYEKSQTADYEVYICGGSSDSGDKIGIMYIDSAYKNELITGRKIIIKDVGAYFEEFFMPYSKDLRKVYIDKK